MFYSVFAIAQSAIPLRGSLLDATRICIYSDQSLCPSDYDQKKTVEELKTVSPSDFSNYSKVFIAGEITIKTKGTLNDTLKILEIRQCGTELADDSCNYEFGNNSKLTLEFTESEFENLKVFGNSENFEFKLDLEVTFNDITLSDKVAELFPENFVFNDPSTNLTVMMKSTDEERSYDWTKLGEKDLSIEISNTEDNNTRVHIHVNPKEMIKIRNYTISTKTKRIKIKLAEYQPLQIEQENLDLEHILTVGSPGKKGVFLHLNDSFVNLNDKVFDVSPSDPMHVIFYISSLKIPFFLNSSNMTVEVRPPIPEVLKGSKTAEILAIVIPLAMILAIIIVEIILIIKDKRNAITDSTYKKVF